MYYTSSNAYGSTGSKTINPGFTPAGIRVSIGQKYGSDTTISHQSTGTGDGTRQNVISTYDDGTTRQTVQNNTAIASHYDKVSGSPSEVCAATLTSLSSSGAVLNVTKTNANYTWVIEMWD